MLVVALINGSCQLQERFVAQAVKQFPLLSVLHLLACHLYASSTVPILFRRVEHAPILFGIVLEELLQTCLERSSLHDKPSLAR